MEQHCRMVREGEGADATEEARRGHAAVNSCGGVVNVGAGKTSPVGSGWSKAGQWRDGDRHFITVLGWMEEDEQLRKMELAPENPATKVGYRLTRCRRAWRMQQHKTVRG